MVSVRPPLDNNKPSNTMKFLCSYGGKIVPRQPDGKLRYLGGHTRVLAVDRSVSFSELVVKMGELCGTTVTLRCQLPNEDLDALVTIKSDEDLANLVEEYDRLPTSSSMKIRAFLYSIRTKRVVSPPTSESGASSSPSPKSLSPSSSFSAAGSSSSSPRFMPVPVAVQVSYKGRKPVVQQPQGLMMSQYGCHHCYGNSGQLYLIHNGNHWQ